MKINLIIYTIFLFISVFAVSGINIQKIMKSNAIWETRFLIFLIIMSFTYLSSSLVIAIMENTFASI